MKRTLAFSSVALCLALGCHSSQPKPTHTIALLDISGSIYPEEVDREFSEMQKLAYNMHRGDELTLIPITGNAHNDTPGHILRLLAPQSRAPFDSDLVAFQKDAYAAIARMKDWAKRNPASHTDILGTLEISGQQIDQMKSAYTKLVVMSDFLEDDGQINFTRDRALTSVVAARASADDLAKHRVHPFRTDGVSLERLRSRDRAALSNMRLEAVDAFWEEFLGKSEADVGNPKDGEAPSST